MGRGILGGMALGAFVALVGATTLSLILPLPERLRARQAPGLTPPTMSPPVKAPVPGAAPSSRETAQESVDRREGGDLAALPAEATPVDPARGSGEGAGLDASVSTTPAATPAPDVGGALGGEAPDASDGDVVAARPLPPAAPTAPDSMTPDDVPYRPDPSVSRPDMPAAPPDVMAVPPGDVARDWGPVVPEPLLPPASFPEVSAVLPPQMAKPETDADMGRADLAEAPSDAPVAAPPSRAGAPGPVSLPAAPDEALPQAPEVSAPQGNPDEAAPARPDTQVAGLPVPPVEPRPEAPRVTPPAQPDPAPAQPDPAGVEVSTPQDSNAKRVRIAASGNRSPESKVRVNRLPQIGTEPESRVPESETETEVAPASERALDRNAVHFQTDAPERPYMAVLLLDDGSDLALEALSDLGFPVSVVIAATQADAASRARAYRKAGHEVVMAISGLPSGARAQDVEVTLGSYIERFDVSVAMMEPVDGARLSRGVLQQIMTILAASGHGMVSFDQGLNTADQIARAGDVPSLRVFRDIDGRGQNASAIRRLLERAAFKAGQDGEAAVLARAQPETLRVLSTWALEGNGGQLNLAPVSALLNRD